MINRPLKYMLNNNPSVTLSQRGSDNRKKIRPIFLKLLKMGNKLKLNVEKKEDVKKDRPIIYVCSHAFKDDVLNTLVTIEDDAYVVFGNIDLFFNTLDGFFLWVYGTQLVDRYDKESRHAMKNKMEKIIELGNNIIIFPEATWNMSPNNLMEKFHWGFYDIAYKYNAQVVPVLTYKVGKDCFSRQLAPINVKEINEEDVKNISSLINRFFNKTKDLNIYKDSEFLRFKEFGNEIERLIMKLNKCDDIIIQRGIIECIELSCKRFVNSLPPIHIDDEIKKSAYDLIKKLYSRISTANKEVIVTKIRDIMATEKYDMYEKHPDYSYQKDNNDIYDQWDKYIDETLKGTPYFYKEPEATTLFKDPLIKDQDEVMPKLILKR